MGTDLVDVGRCPTYKSQIGSLREEPPESPIHPRWIDSGKTNYVLKEHPSELELLSAALLRAACCVMRIS